jgi:ABC-type uncharacterized transport system fused permease/ATPase subunit
VVVVVWKRVACFRFAMVCNGLQWFAIVCNRLQSFAIVCNRLQSFAMGCVLKCG